MTLEELFKTLNHDWAKELASEILRRGWYPETVVYLKDPYNPVLACEERVAWCKENCLKKWKEYGSFYWLFESEKEAMYFKTVWG